MLVLDGYLFKLTIYATNIQKRYGAAAVGNP